MKVNLILFSLFLLVSIMACNVFAFSISGGGSERSYKETEKTSAMTTTHSTNFSHHRRFCFKMREDAPPLNLTEEMPPPFPTKANYLIHPVR
ncbi:putative lipoprotein involved in colanic acid biosynthesis [Escherichia coli]|uniref:Putative lipoprotein involved in colanic acid biosynthesis n=1 Tax=Escherichia coli TaxID=562 RepID=A0A377D1Q4_ECOLX|nr:putative lipoprotein involved in colanic acid biosynthesis [Escherichia coli]